MERGIGLIEWTFDPLQVKNAYFNLHRLGAVSSRYEPDFYGDLRSRLQPGLATDRLVAQWWLCSARVSRAIAGEEPAEATEERIRFAPGDKSAAEVQRALRESMQDAFARGLLLSGFTKGPDGGGTYLLSRHR